MISGEQSKKPMKRPSKALQAFEAFVRTQRSMPKRLSLMQVIRGDCEWTCKRLTVASEK